MTKKTENRGWWRNRRTSLLWSFLLVTGAAACIFWFWPCWKGMECNGGDPLLLQFGRLGLAAIALSVIYSFRKNLLHHFFLSLEQWLYGHVVIGTLSLYLVIAHSGFQFQNKIAVLALIFLVLTVLSGVAGLFLFYFLPRRQSRHETAVLVPVDLCRRLSLLHEEISELCSNGSAVFLEVYNELVIPLYRTAPGRESPPCSDVSRWADKITAEEEEKFMRLASKVEEVHDLLVLLGQNMRFQWRIRGWLLLHVPASIGLVVFTVAHLISVAWFGVFR